MKCKNCYKRKTLKFDLLKQTNHPRIYVVECGLCPSSDYESDCPYFEKKDYFKRILRYLTKKKK